MFSKSLTNFRGSIGEPGSDSQSSKLLTKNNIDKQLLELSSVIKINSAIFNPPSIGRRRNTSFDPQSILVYLQYLYELSQVKEREIWINEMINKFGIQARPSEFLGFSNANKYFKDSFDRGFFKGISNTENYIQKFNTIEGDAEQGEYLGLWFSKQINFRN